MKPLVEIQSATVRVGLKEILAECSLTISGGELWALLGANGSGKTVLSELIAGRRKPSSGRVEFTGIPNPDRGVQVISFERQLDLLRKERRAEESWLMNGATDPGTTVSEFLSNVPSKLLDEFRIRHLLDRGLRFLSTGEIRKTLLCRTLAAQPQLLILDDPYDGLDAEAQKELHATIRGASRAGTAVVLVLGRAFEMGEEIDHVAFLEQGRLTFQGRREELGRHARFEQPAAASKLDSPAEIPGFHHGDPASSFSPGTPLIVMRRVKVSYGDNRVLKSVDWTVEAGQSWHIIGPNGAGKTTLLSLVTGSNPRAYGQEIELFGRRRGSGESVWEIKEQIGIVSGDFHNSYPQRTRTLDAVLSGFTDSAGLYEQPSGYQVEIAMQWLRLLGLENHVDSRLRKLSYGQQRAVLVARAMVKLPPILIADEPCQGLDDSHSTLVLSLIDRISSETRTTVLYVSHNPGLLLQSTTHRLTLTPHPEGSTVTVSRANA